jgi:hypothetical protein
MKMMKRSIAAIVLTALAAAASASVSTETGREDGIKLRVIGGAPALQATAAVNATVPTIGAVPVATEAGEPLSGRESDVEQIA